MTVDGSYGAATERAVKVFQQKQSLTADGVVGQTTWNALYAAWLEAQSDLGGTAWPGTALRRGSTGMEVRLVQFWLRLAAVLAGGGRRDRAQHLEQIKGSRPGRGQQNCGLRRSARPVHSHGAPGQQRHRCAGRAVLPAAAGGLLQRCAHRDGGRHLWRGDHPRGACLAGAGGPDRGRYRRPTDLAEHLRRCAGLGDQRPGGPGGGSYLPHRNAETRRQRPGWRSPCAVPSATLGWRRPAR